jgi:glycosyltransferase involved in cell wall biosynthesis
MRLALLKGNRFNPWHLQGFRRLRGNPQVTAFRAESEVQSRLRQRDDGSCGFDVEPIYFDTQAGGALGRWKNTLLTRYFGREPRIVPFHERLREFDVIQSWELFTDWSGEALAAKERFGIPLAVMVWDNIPFNMERNPDRRELKRRVGAGADRFLVYTERSRRMLGVEGVPLDRVVRLSPGVDTEAFSPGPGSRSEFGVPEEAFVVLFVGWLLPRKGLDFLLLALRELLVEPTLKGHDIRLLVVGSGPGQDRIDRLIARLDLRDACVFVEPVPYDLMPAVFRSADLFVLPSIATPEWQEQFGMAIIEAMASGLPTISSLTGGVAEIVGEAGILCQPSDFFGLYEAMKRLILDPAEREGLGAAGRARAVERFNLQSHADALSDAYDGLVRESA